MDLYEWSLIFLKHQDLFKKEIKSLREEPGKIILQKKRDETWLVQTKADFSQEAYGIICLNSQQNFNTLLTSWNGIKPWKIVFANPRTNERWVVVPEHHKKIADDASFKTGLQAMFASIAEY